MALYTSGARTSSAARSLRDFGGFCSLDGLARATIRAAVWFLKRTPVYFWVFTGIAGLTALSLLVYTSDLTPLEIAPIAVLILALVLAHIPVKLSPLISFQGAYGLLFFLVYEYRSPYLWIPAILLDAYMAWRDLPRSERQFAVFSAARMAVFCAYLALVDSMLIQPGLDLAHTFRGHVLAVAGLVLVISLFNWLTLAAFDAYRRGAYILRTGLTYDLARYAFLAAFTLLLAISWEVALETGLEITFATTAMLTVALQLVMFAWQCSERRMMSIERLLIGLMDWRDRYADTRSLDNRDLSVAYARYLKWHPRDIEVISNAGLLQDVGKVVVSDSILHKQERLTAAEFDIMKKHIDFSADSLKAIAGFGAVVTAVRDHHERWDGKGYPAGKSGGDISACGRLLMLTDSFLAMVSARPFRPGMAREKVLKIIEGELGTQFDPELGKDFLKFMQEGSEPLDALIFYPAKS